MVECICVNDKNRPKEIPLRKWIKNGEKYTVVFALTVLPQKQLAFHLAEIELDETCHPFEYFLSTRFAFTQEGIKQLEELIKDCIETDFSIEELMKQTELVEI